MGSLTSAINVNVDTKIKDQATAILKDLGLNMSTFINIALTQVVKRDGIPFEIVNPKPSKETLQALKEAEDIINGKIQTKGYRDMDELRKALVSDD